PGELGASARRHVLAHPRSVEVDQVFARRILSVEAEPERLRRPLRPLDPVCYLLPLPLVESERDADELIPAHLVGGRDAGRAHLDAANASARRDPRPTRQREAEVVDVVRDVGRPGQHHRRPPIGCTWTVAPFPNRSVAMRLAAYTASCQAGRYGSSGSM